MDDLLVLMFRALKAIKRSDGKQHQGGLERAIPGRVCSVGHQSADQQFVAVLSSNVERSIAILIHTINFPA